MLVDAVYRKTVKHVERSHPLRVTLGKVVVYSNDVYAIACKGVEEYRECSHKGLTFTCCHLGNLTLMQNDTTENLYIIMHHFPLEVVATSCPMVVIDGIVAIDCYKVVLWVGSKLAVEISSRNDCFLILGKAACRILYNSKGYRHNLVECLLVDFQNFLLKLVDSIEYAFALINRSLLNLCLQLCNLSFLLVGRILHILLQLFCTRTQFIIAQRFYLRISGLYFLYKGLNQLHVL